MTTDNGDGNTRYKTGGKMIIEFFPPNVFALQRELYHHPDLVAQLETVESKDWTIRLAKLAALCNVALDDYYTPEDINRICGILIKILREKRTGLIIVDKLRPN